MKTYHHLVILTVFVCFGLSEQVQPERLCGVNLANALDLVCFDRGFHWDVKKRSGMRSISKKWYYNSYQGKRTNGRRGVVEECCYSGCTYNMLESYCAQPGDNQAVIHGNRFRYFMGRPTLRPVVPQSTTRPVAAITTPTLDFPSAVFNSHQRHQGPRKQQYFYVHLGTRPTRSPLI